MFVLMLCSNKESRFTNKQFAPPRGPRALLLRSQEPAETALAMADPAEDDAASTATRNPLIIAAERTPASRATHSGWLHKHSTGGKWSRRFFVILPSVDKRNVSYLVYYKTSAPNAPMLAAMDLSQAGDASLVPRMNVSRSIL